MTKSTLDDDDDDDDVGEEPESTPETGVLRPRVVPVRKPVPVLGRRILHKGRHILFSIAGRKVQRVTETSLNRSFHLPS